MTTIDDLSGFDVHVKGKSVPLDELRKLFAESIRECEDFKFIANNWVKCSEEFGQCKKCEGILEFMPSVKKELKKKP